jgi:ech hydrogenase subunit E
MVTIVPFGPQHPILAEPIRYLLALEEETVVGVEYEIGYMHKGIEKAMENDYIRNIYMAERVCGICSMVHSTTYVNAVERLAGIVVSERVKFIRTVLLELERLHSHLLWLGIVAESVGFQNLFMLCWRDRELIMDVLEALTGNRLHFSMNTVGGLRRDINPERIRFMARNLDRFAQSVRKIENSLYNDLTVVKRLRGVGFLTREDCERYGVVGPNARASGCCIDARMDGYEAYEMIDFSPILKSGGDNLDRVVIRMDEVFQSIGLIRECVRLMPEGDIGERYKKRIDGEAVFRCEAPRGELFYYVRGNGSKKLDRVKIRTPTLANLAMMEKVMIGLEFADVPATALFFDPCMSCQDR